MRNHHALICAIFLFCRGAQSLSTFDNFRDIRWLGRGNTGVAVINDGTAAFYNPGGIGAIEDYSFTLANPSGAGNQNFVSSIRELATLTSGGGSITDKFEPFLGKPLGLQASTFPNIAVPGFVAGFWDYFDTQLEYRNPVNPQLQIQSRNDYGLVFGGGKSINNKLFVGASLRYVRRKVMDTTVSGSTLLTASPSYLTSLFGNGEGWGLNLGAQLRQPMGKNRVFSLGLAVEDIGRTRFINRQGGLSPEVQDQKVNIGSAYSFKGSLFDAMVLFDIKRISDPDISYTKRIHMGVELSILRMDLRGGFFHGYWTAGASIRLLPIMDIDFATYAEELDTAAGMRQNRMWLIGINMGLELKKTQKRRQRFDLSTIK